MNHDLKKVVEYVGGEPVVKFEKGDVEGHEFHGNQYTGSSGSSSRAERRAAIGGARGEVPGKSYEQRLKEYKAKEEAKDKAAERTVKFNEAASYYPQYRNQISNMKSGETIRVNAGGDKYELTRNGDKINIQRAR